MNRRILWTTTLLLLISTMAFSGGMGYPSDFFFQGGRSLYALPGAAFDAELIIILDTHRVRDQRTDDAETQDGLGKTAEADIADLRAVLAEDPDADEKTAAYTALRNAITDYVSFYKESEQRYRYAIEREAAPRDPFDITPYEALLESIPKEFALYMRGGAAWHSNAWEAAAASFAAILELTPEQRAYRSVWAAFMLGRTLLALEEPSAAIPLFEKTRTLVAEGYKDTLELIGPSLRWQGRAHYLADEDMQALRIYLEHGAYYNYERLSAASINLVFRKIFNKPALYEEVAQDEMLRLLFTVWMYCRSFDRDKARHWLDKNAALLGDGAVVGAEWFAALAYQIGEMDTAAQWLVAAPADAFQSLMVRAKLLMREGNIEEGTEILKTLAQTEHDYRRQLYVSDWFFSVSVSCYLSVDLAGGLLRSDQYAEALRALLVADQWRDAAFVAERLMTIPELEAFVAQQEYDEEFLDALRKISPRRASEGEYPRSMINLKHLLARRLARNGQWRAAAPFYPDKRGDIPWRDTEEAPALRDLALQVADYLEAAENKQLSARDRAKLYFEAAGIIRQEGMRLMGAVLYPDWAVDDGHMGYPPFDASRHGESVFTEKAAARFKESAIEPDKRFHYRYIAAELMRQCADLLPNNDPLTAEALYLGGIYLKHRDPEAADPFYKALVRRNPNLLVAKQADELRWFPREFTDVVLYKPRTTPLLPRKRTLAMYGASGALVLLGMIVLVWHTRNVAKHKPTHSDS